MDPIEQRVRESLQARAEDVEPTPHLYRGVQERIGRRQRLRVAAWSLAGLAAVAAAVLVVPTVLANLDQRTPEVADTPDPVETPEGSSAPGEPTHALLAFDDLDGAVVDLVELGSGARDEVWNAEDPDAAVTALVAAPGGTAERFRAAAVVARGDGPASLVVIERGGAGPTVSVTPTSDLPGGTGVPPVIAISADGEWLAYTGISQTVDAAVAVYVVRIDAVDATLDPARAVEVHTPAAADAPDLLRGLRGWIGPTSPEGAVSHLFVATSEGVEALVLERADTGSGSPGSPRAQGFTDVERVALDGGGVEDVASGLVVDVSHTHLDADLAPAHRLAFREDGALEVAFDGTRSVIGDRFVHDDEVRLDARGRTALLVGGGTAVTVRYLEVGMERGPAPAPEVTDLAEGVTAGALLGGAALTGPDPVEETPEEVPGPAGGPLGDGLVVASDTTVSLVRPDGSQQELVTFPAEGESTVVDVAVRPGSTADDLTVAITTRAEGTFDVRSLRVVGGEVDTGNLEADADGGAEGTTFPAEVVGSTIPAGVGGFPVTAPDLQDGGEPAAAWSPDGDLLAVFVRLAPGEPAEVRTIGWDEDGPSEDGNLAATFQLDTDRPLTLRGWSWTDDAEAEVAREGQLLLVDRMAREAFTVRLDRQGDGAPAMPNVNPLVSVEQGRPGEVLDLADADGDGTVDTWLGVSDPHPMLYREQRDGTGDGAIGWDVEVDAAGPRDVSFVATSPQLILVVLDPAQPMLVDPASGDVRPAPLEGEVVSADVVR
jgi:hypothetical protein